MSIMRRAASSGMLAASRVMGNPTVRKAQGHWRTMNQMASMADALGWVQHTDPQLGGAVEQVKRAGEAGRDRPVDSVALLGAVDGDDQDAAVTADQNVVGRSRCIGG